ncbi:MAG: transglutaminase-like domain-containing protein [Desulfobacterales bacterium]
MKIRYHHICSCLLIFLIFIIAVAGCTSSTKPNTPYSGPYPKTFNSLANHNPLLAQEFGKIPEIQDGISEKDAMALERICVYYNQNQKDFDAAFERMYDVGYPKVRKFCTPLQAFYWLALDDKLNQIDISKYALIGLLNEAWYKSGFGYDGTGRWDNFRDVTERLNSPRLVDFYVSRNFTYKKIRLRTLDEYKNPHIFFSRKQGECWLYTTFCLYCLKKAGYQAHAITVYHGNSKRPNHVTCLYVDKDGYEYIMDNSLPAYVHGTGIYEKAAYLEIYPYYGKGYLSE